MNTILDPESPARPANVCSALSLAALLGGCSSIIAFAPKGWDGLGWILLGLPACVGLAIVLGLLAWARREAAGPWATAVPVVLVGAFLLAVAR